MPFSIPISRIFIFTASHSSDCFTSFTIRSRLCILLSFTIISGLSKVVFFMYCRRLINSGLPFLLVIFRKIFFVPSSRCSPGTSSHCSVNVYMAESHRNISSRVIKIMIVDGRCLYFVFFPDFNTGVSRSP